jgi:hypothetical protein
MKYSTRYFNPQVVSAQHYYTFGMLQQRKNYNAEGFSN